jgi:sugar phosphate isomerase/epimerase
MRLAFYTYSYTDRLKMSIPDCLERIAKTGYSGIDVSATNGPSDDPRSFDDDRRRLTRQTAEKHCLRIEAMVTHAELTNTLFDPKLKPLDLQRTIDLATAVGGTAVTVHAGGYPEGVERRTVWDKTVNVIKEAADYGAARHVRLMVDGIWPDWIDSSPDELERLFDDVDSPNFGVNLDPGVLTMMGVDPVEFIRRFDRHIFHAHLKDHITNEPKDDGPKWTQTMLGRGEVDYVRVFQALGRIKFNESAAAECFTFMEFEEACDSSFTAMVDAARKAGVPFTKAS